MTKYFKLKKIYEPKISILTLSFTSVLNIMKLNLVESINPIRGGVWSHSVGWGADSASPNTVKIAMVK